jgi:hypothetical protein
MKRHHVLQELAEELRDSATPIEPGWIKIRGIGGRSFTLPKKNPPPDPYEDVPAKETTP